MAAKLIIDEDPEVLIKDIAQGYLNGNHTLLEMLSLVETIVCNTLTNVKQ